MSMTLALILCYRECLTLTALFRLGKLAKCFLVSSVNFSSINPKTRTDRQNKVS